jgi:isocitrate dehydrogenase (NAD+)
MAPTAHTVTLIPGDGIGPEISECAKRMIAACGAKIEWDEVEAGAALADSTGNPIPDRVLDSIRKHRVCLKGPIGTPIGTGFRSVNVTLRKTLNLYACVRPIKSIPKISTRYPNVDFIIVRENMEGEYSGLEHMVVPGVAESLKIITEEASLRIAKYAFQLARDLGRNKVTAVHKANIMKLTDGLFLSCVRRIAAKYPDINHEELIVDNCAMQLVKKPEQFDVLVMTNLYGDILSDLGAGLVGGLGVVPGANIGDQYAVYEAVHGSAPDIAGKGLANPAALALSGAMMLRQLALGTEADRLEGAIYSVFAQGEKLTRDLGGSASSAEFTDAVIAAMK